MLSLCCPSCSALGRRFFKERPNSVVLITVSSVPSTGEAQKMFVFVLFFFPWISLQINDISQTNRVLNSATSSLSTWPLSGPALPRPTCLTRPLISSLGLLSILLLPKGSSLASSYLCMTSWKSPVIVTGDSGPHLQVEWVWPIS